MNGQDRFALLDTDFIIKATIIQSDTGVLADEVLSFPGYKFFCHKKMRDEIVTHAGEGTRTWLDKKIEAGKIELYDDARIIKELREAVGENCYHYYKSFLLTGCNMFGSHYYDKYFEELDGWLEEGCYEEGQFLGVLERCEEHIGHKNDYGEVKAFVLLSMLKLLYVVEVCLFCSDDFGARQGFSNTAQIPCISIIAVFLKLKQMGRSYESVNTLFRSFVDWSKGRENPQTHIRIWKNKDGTIKRVKTPINGILNDIYDGKYVVRKNGDLEMI